ncbi:MAG: hypothetical protein U5L45_26235 [Saprospiraceae bacterium]|nr:hypothetical protein [Saprospiraceae bacterium]
MLAQRQAKRWFIFRRSRKMNHIPILCASEVCLHPESLRESAFESLKGYVLLNNVLIFAHYFH